MPGGRSVRRAASAVAVAALIAAVPAHAEQRGLVPDHAKLQLAGAIGLVSAGTGYALFGRRLEADVFLGWVPPSIADLHLVMLTGKLTWLPWTARLTRAWRLRPITVGMAVTYTFGDRFFLRNPDRYPRGYYPIATAVRGSFQLGGTIGRPVGRFSELALYWELVAVDVPLVLWWQNSRVVGLEDVVSLALGVRGTF
jgi:hypothetical protein